MYSVTPLYHPSALMMSIGGAIAGGARLAMARNFDPSTFWDEVAPLRSDGRVSYTWTLLHDLAEAPPDPASATTRCGCSSARGCRVACGGGSQERFAPARVLEFYASTEAGAILVNLRDDQGGAAWAGPLPGSAAVKIARYDLEAGGLAARTRRVRARVRRRRGRDAAREGPADRSATVMPLRGVFSPEDAWVADRRPVQARRGRRPLAGRRPRRRDPNLRGAGVHDPIRDALGELPAVDLAVATESGHARTRPRSQSARSPCGAAIGSTARELGRALAGLDPAQRPAIVEVVERIPVTTWYRPITATLRDAGVPEPGEGRRRGTGIR